MYYMALRATFQSICLEVTGKPCYVARCRSSSTLIFLVGADVDSRVLLKADKNYVKNAVFRAH